MQIRNVAVAEDLVELVPVTPAASVCEIDFGVDDFLAVTACRNRPAGTTNDNTLTNKWLAALHTRAVGGSDE
jgi:hypothetical protein